MMCYANVRFLELGEGSWTRHFLRVSVPIISNH
jgi:hypothetical protein